MFIHQGQDYLADAIAFAVATVPVFFAGVVIVAAMLEEPLRIRAARARGSKHDS